MHYTVRLLLAVALVGGGCAGDGESSSDNQLVGTWETPNGYYRIHRTDGTTGTGYSAAGADTDPFGWGTYTFDGDLYKITSGEGTSCGAGTTGTYEVTFSETGDVATFSPVEDACEARIPYLSGELTRHTDEP